MTGLNRHLTVSDSARQQNVNFLMCDLVTELPAFSLLLGLFCREENNISGVNKPFHNNLSPLQETHVGECVVYLVKGRVHCSQFS